MEGKTLGRKSLEEKILKKKEKEEEEKGFSLRFVYSLTPPLFSFLLMVVFSLKMFWLAFLGLRYSQRHECMISFNLC